MIDRSFVNYVLLHGYSLDNFSLMYGKMGCALSLFEYSRYYHDELAEKYAFKLLHEVLASSIEKNTFNEGKTGIAWSLIYLINNQYIEAEYQDLYGQEHEQVLASIKQMEENKTTNISSYIDATSFLMISKKYIPISDYESILWALTNNLSTYFSVTPKNFFEFTLFYEIASKILGCYNLYDELTNHKRNLVDIIVQISLSIFNDGLIYNNISFGTNLLQYGIYYKREDIKKIANEFIDS